MAEIEEARRRVAQLSDEVLRARQEQQAQAREVDEAVELARLLGEEQRLQQELELIQAASANQQNNVEATLDQFTPDEAPPADAPPLGTIAPEDHVVSSAIAGTVTADRLEDAEATPSRLVPSAPAPSPTFDQPSREEL